MISSDDDDWLGHGTESSVSGWCTYWGIDELGKVLVAERSGSDMEVLEDVCALTFET
jgi:hypothetical protein